MFFGGYVSNEGKAGFEPKGVQCTAINLKRTFICPKWHSLKSPAFAGFLAICNWLAFYKNTPFFSNFSPIYAAFMKNTVLGKAKHGAFSHGKSRVAQLTSSHQSMSVIANQWVDEAHYHLPEWQIGLYSNFLYATMEAGLLKCRKKRLKHNEFA